ncbi:hypothetical protein PFICI_05670 [Pestalotiopsis fici W106-1]|uniref:SAP domain-containing protein n=1 Tax=Pestalotiopsis fici (strain W106-1 / CGMCC3.15140) TaxID=1229662 RepID=W3XCR6_PESFW|nr:uncharacterized protein PFICI_05670 [Pestalotiopsis fici W106-1]ETS83794.1 hypothetical protein PFICI_05670 [Pestalotiopsis fici W106-1]
MATDYSKLKVTELKAELKRLGLPQNGLKAELVARLEEATLEATEATDQEADALPIAENDEVNEQVPEENENIMSEAAELPAPLSDTDPDQAEQNVQQAPSTQDAAHPRQEQQVSNDAEGQSDVPQEDIPSQTAQDEQVAKPIGEEPPQEVPMTGVQDSFQDNMSSKDTAAPEPESALIAEAAQPIVVTDFATSEPQPQVSILASSSSATPMRPADILQDSQKRKRRSASPPPSPDGTNTKRARLDSEQPRLAAEQSETENKEVVQTEPGVQTDTHMEDAQSGVPADQEDNTQDANGPEPPDAHKHMGGDSERAGSAMVDDVKEVSQLENSTAMGGSLIDSRPAEEPEHDVEPSIHPATTALYIKNFMRPLRPQAVKDHLLDLATPMGVEIDDQTIPEFYLDNIRTHSFVLFNSVAAAKRVRNALHDRVWPDETNRKPLWIDYVPAERYHDWVQMELSAGGGRGSGNRYEVVYEHDRDGNVTANLEQSDAAPPASKPPPPGERKQSIPTGPSRGLTGIEGAPTGPRGFQGGSRPQSYGSRMDRGGGEYKSTSTRPSVAFQPVPEDLAQRRLDAIRQAKSRDYDPRTDRNKEYRRYFFETGHQLVDRGPEIFLGIRPPHRERERRQEQERDERRRGGRNRRNGRRGGNGGMPMHHGVPKGGDRYRGAAADREERGSRGLDRYRGESYHRH